MAPSQAALPPTPAEYPFQCVCADYFHYQCRNFLVVIDRYSNWPIVERAKDGAQGLINVLRSTFATYGIPDELASDGGPEFVSHTTTDFLRDWGIHHRLSSVAFPTSDSYRETLAQKETSAFQKAILQYRNTPDPATKQSPAMCVFGRPIRDLIPIQIQYPQHMEGKPHHQGNCPTTPPHHSDGTQDRTLQDPPSTSDWRPRPSPKWDRTAIVIEVKQYHQYMVRMGDPPSGTDAS